MNFKMFNNLFIMLTCLFSFTAFSQTPMQQLEEYLSNFHTMSANFQQTILAKKGQEKNSSGQMALQRPGKFHWEIVKPNHQIIIADGNNLWIYDIDLEQATKQRLDKGTNSPASLLSGEVKALQSRFIVTSMRQVGDATTFQLKPKSTHDMIQWIELHFVNKELQKMSVLDNLGQKSIFKFSQIKINTPLSPSLFKFHAPQNVDVIQN